MADDDMVDLDDTATKGKIEQVVGGLREIILNEDLPKNHSTTKIKEDAINALTTIYAKTKSSKDLIALSRDIRPLFKDMPKAKTAKIVRTIIEKLEFIPNTADIQIKLCHDSIEWANEEKRTFLRQRIQLKLASLYYNKKAYQEALDLINKLSLEVRKLDDKNLLVEIHLLESQVLHSLKNLPKARSALIAGRTAANAIYVPPVLQAALDVQSGVLHSEESDFKTAYSYFYEAWEAYHNMERKEDALSCLKYMCLSKIMTDAPDDVQNILSSKNALEYQGDAVEAMRLVTKTYNERSLHDFEAALGKYKAQLQDDPVISSHLQDLYEKLLEQHLLRIIEPFSRVEISHVANLIKLPKANVERKLSQMILDQKLNGIMDQGNDCLIVHEDVEKDELYDPALDTISRMNSSIDALTQKAKKLTSA